MDDALDEGSRRWRPATAVVHAGRDPFAYHGFVNPPVVHASTVLYEDCDAADARAKPYTYGRTGTPTTQALCDLMRALEGAERTVLAPSGLAACTLALASCVGTGDRVLVTDNVYGPTRRFCDGFLARFGVTTVYFDPLDLDAYEAELSRGAAAVFFEAPGSLTFEMPDVTRLVASAKAAGATVLIDNTWATPLYFRPLEHGCDLSIHAATKYLAGHSDLLLGTISGNGEAIARVARTYNEWGENVGPDDVFSAMRGIRTLAVRMAAFERNARMVAEWLAADPRVSRVLYPALPGAQGHEVWRTLFDGASSLFAITFKGRTRERVAAFVDALELFGIGSSWGGYESLARISDLEKVRTVRPWPQDEPTVRLAVGLEDPRDLIADLDRALAHVA